VGHHQQGAEAADILVGGRLLLIGIQPRRPAIASVPECSVEPATAIGGCSGNVK
jgi:hypothetical protein